MRGRGLGADIRHSSAWEAGARTELNRCERRRRGIAPPVQADRRGDSFFWRSAGPDIGRRGAPVRWNATPRAWCHAVVPMFPVVDREVHMLDLLTLWLTRPLDRYEATPVQRRAEQAV